MIGQCLEQLGICRRVGFAHIVFGLDDAPVEEVLPVAVNQGRSEEPVLFTRHPVDQEMPRIALGRYVQGRCTQPGRLERFAGTRVGRTGGAVVVEDALLTRVFTILAADPAEESRESVIVVLAPLLEGMMVATSTLNPQAQEQLGRVFDLLVGLRHFAVPGDGRITGHVARRGEHFAHELVERLVLFERVADPLVKRIRATRVLRLTALVAQHHVPFVGEQVGISLAVDQGVNQLVALLWIAAEIEFADLLFGRQLAGNIDRDPANERRVVAYRRWWNTQQLELVLHRHIDEVLRFRQGANFGTQRNRRTEC